MTARMTTVEFYQLTRPEPQEHDDELAWGDFYDEENPY